MGLQRPNDESVEIMKKFAEIRISHLPLYLYLPMLVALLVAIYTGSLNQDVVGTFTLLFLLGGLFFYVGGIIPIVGKWLGGAVLLPLFGGAALVYYHVLPKYVVHSVTTMMNSGFIHIFLSAVIVGAILSMNRKTLLSVSLRVLPCIIGAQVFVIAFLYLSALLLHIKPLEAIFMVGLPNYAGGSTGALVAVPTIYSGFFHHAIGHWAGKFLVLLNISNVLCVFFASLLNQLGKKKPQWTGNGQLLKTTHGTKKKLEASDHVEKVSIKSAILDIGQGFLLSIFFLVVGSILEHFVPQLNLIAWCAIVVIVIKAFGWLDDHFCHAAGEWQSFVITHFLPVLITGIGISSLNLGAVASYLSISNLFILVMALIGAMLGSLIIGRLVGFNPIDAMIGIGLQVGNLGGTGAITTLQTSDRMSLMPFATIANRIGGAIMLIEISFLLPLFL